MTTPRRRRTTAPADGQLGMTLGMLAERPGSQLDLIAEAEVETIGPSTVAAPAPRTITLRTHAGAYGRNRMPDAVHALANELPGVVVGTACGRVFAFARTSGMTVDTEPKTITCAACRDAR